MRSFIILAIACFAQIAVANSDEKNVVCYFGASAIYSLAGGKLTIENINTNLCTHLIYASIGINGGGVEVRDSDPIEADFQRFNALRESNKKIKTLLAIGGQIEYSEKFSDMASNPKCRTEFIQNAVEFVKKHKFDGLDLDWYFPAWNSEFDADVENFVVLIKEMSRVFDTEKLILSAAVGATESIASTSYDIPTLSKYLDFVNLMTYGLHDHRESQTGFHAALYGTDVNDKLSVDYIVNDWLSNGLDPRKLNLGIPFYGVTFTLADATVNSISAPTIGPGRDGGFLSYNDICDMQRKNELIVKYDKKSHAYFGYHEDLWVSFENVKSIKEKAEYIKKIELGGAMIWLIDFDDFNGDCGTKWPLLKAINAVLRKEVDLRDVSTDGPVTIEPTVTPSPMVATVAPKIPIVPILTTPGPAVTHAPKVTTPSPDKPPRVCEKQTKNGNSVDPDSCGFFQCVPQFGGTFKAVPNVCPKNTCFNFEQDSCLWK